MGNVSAGGWLVMGIVLLVLGLLVRSRLFEFLVDFTGLILIVIGLIAVVVALVSMISGKGRRSGSF